ncbi:hypothetical protein MKW98_014434 [Papaver atlanticum]|uniref:Uncharacterized protein n=1 Tax=Papaver atlanticum TaxID=357466 RepID=A0AAD4SA91_9MAGN|nr:hypothetical protein MKW98_014434 [Papaver atlanticum]
MCSNNGFSWRFSVFRARVWSNDYQTNNIGSHAGSNITGFNGSTGNNNKYQWNDDNREKYNQGTEIKAFQNNKDTNISS